MTNQINNQSIIPSTDVIQLTLTLKMTTTQVVKTSVTVNDNSPIQDYVHPDNQTQPTFEMTPDLGSNLSQLLKSFISHVTCFSLYFVILTPLIGIHACRLFHNIQTMAKTLVSCFNLNNLNVNDHLQIT